MFSSDPNGIPDDRSDCSPFNLKASLPSLVSLTMHHISRDRKSDY